MSTLPTKPELSTKSEQTPRDLKSEGPKIDLKDASLYYLKMSATVPKGLLATLLSIVCFPFALFTQVMLEKTVGKDAADSFWEKFEALLANSIFSVFMDKSDSRKPIMPISRVKGASQGPSPAEQAEKERMAKQQELIDREIAGDVYEEREEKYEADVYESDHDDQNRRNKVLRYRDLEEGITGKTLRGDLEKGLIEEEDLSELYLDAVRDRLEESRSDWLERWENEQSDDGRGMGG